MDNNYWSVEQAKNETGKSLGKIRSVISELEEEFPNDGVVIKEPFKGGHKTWVLKNKLLSKLDIKKDTIQGSKASDKYVNHLEEEIKYLRNLVGELQSEKKEDKNRLDFLVKILGEKVQEDMNIKKIHS